MFLNHILLLDHIEIHQIEPYVVDQEQINVVLLQNHVKELVIISNISHYKMEMVNQHNVSVIMTLIMLPNTDQLIVE